MSYSHFCEKVSGREVADREDFIAVGGYVHVPCNKTWCVGRVLYFC